MAMPSYDSNQTLKIVLRNAVAMAPKFDPKEFSSPYRVTVVEGQSAVYLATFSAPKVAYDVCYYIVGKRVLLYSKFILRHQTQFLEAL